MTANLPLKVGDTCAFTKTVSESDVYLFAGITEDFSQVHTNEKFMKTTPYKTRIAHGILSLAISSTASTLIQVQKNAQIPSVSYGYDRLRFVKPIFFGDTITAKYTVTGVDPGSMKTFAKVEVFNQKGELCTAAQHILKFIAPE